MIEKIFEQIKEERARQDEKWGKEFDDRNTVNDWTAYIAAYMGLATEFRATPEEQRENVLKVAALAVAALEAFDRNGDFAKRHYD